MDSRFDRVEEKLDTITEKLSNIDVTLVRNTADLEKHMERTNQNEAMIKSLQIDVAPLKRSQAMMEGAFKAIGIISTIIGFIFGVVKLFLG